MVFSFGNKLVIFFHKVIPPIPESKKPIGYELIKKTTHKITDSFL